MVNVTLELGQQSESVIVQGGAEVLQTRTASVSTTITGRQITEIPFTSRDGLDLVLLLPGNNTPGRPIPTCSATPSIPPAGRSAISRLPDSI